MGNLHKVARILFYYITNLLISQLSKQYFLLEYLEYNEIARSVVLRRRFPQRGSLFIFLT